jgi:hypothetical protein
MHGGAPGSGAPRDNKNALKHGLYTREAIEERRQLRALMRQSRMLIQDIEWIALTWSRTTPAQVTFVAGGTDVAKEELFGWI